MTTGNKRETDCSSDDDSPVQASRATPSGPSHTVSTPLMSNRNLSETTATVGSAADFKSAPIIPVSSSSVSSSATSPRHVDDGDDHHAQQYDTTHPDPELANSQHKKTTTETSLVIMDDDGADKPNKEQKHDHQQVAAIERTESDNSSQLQLKDSSFCGCGVDAPNLTINYNDCDHTGSGRGTEDAENVTPFNNDSLPGGSTTTSFILPTPKKSQTPGSSRSSRGRRRSSNAAMMTASPPTSPFSRIKHEITEKWKMVDWITQCHNPLEYYLPFDFDPNQKDGERRSSMNNHNDQHVGGYGDGPADADADNCGGDNANGDMAMPTAYLAFRVPQHCEYCGQPSTKLCDAAKCARPKIFLHASTPPFQGPKLSSGSSCHIDRKQQDSPHLSDAQLKPLNSLDFRSKGGYADHFLTATADLKNARDKERNRSPKSSTSPVEIQNTATIPDEGASSKQGPLESIRPGPKPTLSQNIKPSSSSSIRRVKIMPYRGNSQKVIGPWLKTTPPTQQQQELPQRRSPSSSSVDSAASSSPTKLAGSSTATSPNSNGSDESSLCDVIPQSKTFPVSRSTTSTSPSALNKKNSISQDQVSLKAKSFQC